MLTDYAGMSDRAVAALRRATDGGRNTCAFVSTWRVLSELAADERCMAARIMARCGVFVKPLSRPIVADGCDKCDWSVELQNVVKVAKGMGGLTGTQHLLYAMLVSDNSSAGLLLRREGLTFMKAAVAQDSLLSDGDAQEPSLDAMARFGLAGQAKATQARSEYHMPIGDVAVVAHLTDHEAEALQAWWQRHPMSKTLARLKEAADEVYRDKLIAEDIGANLVQGWLDEYVTKS